MSYSVSVSPVVRSSCGCTATVWYDSMKASMATFQLHGTMRTAWALFHRSSSGHEAKWAGRISRYSSSEGLPGSTLTNTNPPQVPTLASGRQKVDGSISGKSHAHGMRARVPSRCHVNPWKGQRNSSA